MKAITSRYADSLLVRPRGRLVVTRRRAVTGLSAACLGVCLTGCLAACGEQSPHAPAPAASAEARDRGGAGVGAGDVVGSEDPRAVVPAEVVIAPEAGTPMPPFAFSAEDEALLDEVQRQSFRYLWEWVSPQTGMVYDRSSSRVVSVAGVGFQLSAIPIGVERGWITEEEGRARCVQILRALLDQPLNRKAGLFYHFINDTDAGPVRVGTELVVSTVDSALLFAGAITAGAYFEGEVAELADRMFADADWTAFVLRGTGTASDGRVSLGWRPDRDDAPTGSGLLLPYVWLDSGDEHRLVAFLAACAPDPEHRLDAEHYYSLRRALGDYADLGPIVWFPYSGALFTAFFAHCWIDYAAMGPDDPSAFGVERRARVDWWENSRRLTRLHQLKAEENPAGVPTLGTNAWGLTASDVREGYGVPGVFPDPLPMVGTRADADFSRLKPGDNLGDGTIAPYGAGSAVMFDPARSVAALRHYRALTGGDGAPLVWKGEAAEEFGFRDAFREAVPEADEPAWVAHDYVAIDQGPMTLAIENARSGLIWDLFASHPAVEAGMDRLGLTRSRSRSGE